ncbi:MAG: NAD(P)H-dependent oxidoreductase subunit E [Acidimicrobiia bacterium]
MPPGARAAAEEVIALYPRPRSAVMPLLHLVQDEVGWVPSGAIQEVAELLGLTSAEVLGVCSFYTMFKLHPSGRLLVSVCTNVSCLVNGGPELLSALERAYDDTPDVTVEEVECLAACDGAPVLQVNYEFFERMTLESAERLIEECRSGEREARGMSGGRTR